ERQSDPADDPDHDRRDVADRILVAEQPGDDHQQQHAARERARNGGERYDQTTLGLPIDMRGEKPVLGTQKQAETNERQRDGRPGAPYVKRKRNRQIVALPEAVRGGGTASGEAENKRQASEELTPAPRHDRAIGGGFRDKAARHDRGTGSHPRARRSGALRWQNVRQPWRRAAARLLPRDGPSAGDHSRASAARPSRRRQTRARASSLGSPVSCGAGRRRCGRG